jgi:hypothetical protein
MDVWKYFENSGNQMLVSIPIYRRHYREVKSVVSGLYKLIHSLYIMPVKGFKEFTNYFFFCCCLSGDVDAEAFAWASGL